MVIDLTQILNTQPAQNASLNNALSQPQNTFMQDLSAGYKDNYNTPIALNNFAPDANKTWANRIGEGLGTVGRIIDSPSGRMALAGGLTAMLGGSNTDIAKEALGAYVGRQNTQTADKLYRNQLESMGIDTSDIGGNITKDSYSAISPNVVKTQGLKLKQEIAMAKDNRDVAKMILQGWEKGMLNADDVKAIIAARGITIEDLQESNNTRKTDSQIELNEAKTEDIKNPKPKTIISIRKGGTNSTVNHIHSGGSGSSSDKSSKYAKPTSKQGNIINFD